jgi:hypothetical protein
MLILSLGLILVVLMASQVIGFCRVDDDMDDYLACVVQDVRLKQQ